MLELIEQFKTVKVLVLGDIMLDQYWWGVVDRISPEAPVPIVSLNKKSVVAGGAANVAANIIGLGATPLLFGSIGNDADGDQLRGILGEMGITDKYLVVNGSHLTTVKTRIIANNQQVIRLDRENTSDIPESARDSILAEIDKVIEETDVVIISDYAKGFVTASLVSLVIERAKGAGTPVLVDPKGKDYSKYRGASVLTPNQKEALDAAGLEGDDEETVRSAGEKLISDHNFKNLVITRGEKGMSLFGENSHGKKIETVARRVYDVTGAGDTVISTMAVSLGSGCDFVTSCSIANIAAGIVVERLGTTAININDLKRYLST